MYIPKHPGWLTITRYGRSVERGPTAVRKAIQGGRFPSEMIKTIGVKQKKRRCDEYEIESVTLIKKGTPWPIGAGWGGKREGAGRKKENG